MFGTPPETAFQAPNRPERAPNTRPGRPAGEPTTCYAAKDCVHSKLQAMPGGVPANPVGFPIDGCHQAPICLRDAPSQVFSQEPQSICP